MQINNKKNKNQSAEDAIRNNFWIDNTELYDDAMTQEEQTWKSITSLFCTKEKQAETEIWRIIISINSDIKLTKDFVSIYEWIDKYWCKKEFIFYDDVKRIYGDFWGFT